MVPAAPGFRRRRAVAPGNESRAGGWFQGRWQEARLPVPLQAGEPTVWVNVNGCTIWIWSGNMGNAIRDYSTT